MPLNAYRELLSANRRLLGFGFVTALYSSFGQTYFIGIVGPAIQLEFGLSHTLWGMVYMIGTIGSAALLPWTGGLIDRFALRRYTLAACLLLVFACAYITTTTGPVMLVLAIFLLRHAGQGLISHISITSMARYFDRERGRAIAFASLGFTVGEAILPIIAVSAIALIGWRWTYGAAAVLIGLTVIPTVIWLLKGHDTVHSRSIEVSKTANHTSQRAVRSWTRREVLRHYIFYFLMPGVLAFSMIGTALFFHHLNLADEKGWSHAWITGNYSLFAATTVVTLIFAGTLVDRLTAIRIMPYLLSPLALAMVTIGLIDSMWGVIPYMLLMGIQSGFYFPVMSALWAELYGVGHIGAIKSLNASAMVLSSAIGPVLMGWLADLGVPLSTVCLYFAVYAAAAAVLVFLALRIWKSQPLDVPNPSETSA
ncbi:MAG: MFS transporter [Arenicellales bacterium]|nr:MFS transporter [Arenicellales bacterium]